MKTYPKSVLISVVMIASALPFRSFAPPLPCTNTVQNLNDSGPGSLRAALANATNGETITFCTNLTGIIGLPGGVLGISNSVTILGPGANILTVGFTPIGRIFYVSSNTVVTIAGLTIQGGNSPVGAGGGGGIYNDHAALTVSNCSIIANQASVGGGIYNDGRFGGVATLKVINSTFLANIASQSGGGIFNDNEAPGSANATLVNCTLNGNRANQAGGGVFNGQGASGPAIVIPLGTPPPPPLGGLVAVLNCTFSTNFAPSGAGIFNNNAIIGIGSTILDASSVASIGSISGGITSLGYNLASDNGGGFLTQSTDLANTAPMLGPLQNNGGPTLTLAPLCGSPAIDKGTNFSGLATDQRGAPRIFDDLNITNASGGDGTDIGAVESPIFAFTVLNTNDSGPGSLRQAIADANASGGTELIRFDTNAYGTILLTSGELLITNCLILEGPGPTNVAVNGNAASRVFSISNAGNVTITGLTITGGLAGRDFRFGSGGGILNNFSKLTIGDCAFSGNVASTGGGMRNEGGVVTILNSTFSHNSGSGNGGAIANAADMMTILNCTFDGNSSILGSGGGIANFAIMTIANSTLSTNLANGGGGLANVGVMTILNSTISGNSSIRFPGGIYNSATLKVFNSTISGNSAGIPYPAGGIYNAAGSVSISSTIIDEGGGSGVTISNYLGVVTSLGYNLSSDDGGGVLTNSTDITNTAPLLGPLQDNGGPTFTHALLCGSPAIDAGTNFLGLTYDQRGAGFPRTVGAATDIGAFELEHACTPPTVTCPDSGTVEQTSPAGSLTNVIVSVSDVLGSQVTVVWSVNGVTVQTNSITAAQPPAVTLVTLSATFPPGTNTVGATAMNAAGASSCSAIVAVVDTTPPTIVCPTNIVATNDTGQCSAVVNFTPTATDASGIASLTSDPASGSTFPTGTTTVSVTAVDNAGLTNTCPFTVTVLDKEAPSVQCRPAPNPSGKISEPGKNGSTGVNPNGYYELLAGDNCTAKTNILIYVKDTGSTFVAGPFHDGDIVRLKHAGSAPSSSPGSAPIVAVISLKGNGLNVAQDASGNMTPDAAGCLMQVSLTK